MKSKEFLRGYLLAKPMLRMIFFELPVLIAAGILGELCSWEKIPFQPFSNIAGFAVMLCGWIFHQYCHRFHKNAHLQSHQIEAIVKSGPFAAVRHPMYLSLIVMYFGFVIAWGVMWMFIPFLIVCALTVMTMKAEEEILLRRFGHQYERYMEQTRRRIIPELKPQRGGLK